MAYLVDGTNANYMATAVIPSAGTTSGVIVVPDNCVLTHILTPAAVTGTALKISAAETSGGTYLAVTDAAGTDISLTMAASKALGIHIDTHRVRGLKFFKIISGSAEEADRTFKLLFDRIV